MNLNSFLENPLSSVIVGIVACYILVKFASWKADRDVSQGKFSDRTPLWSRYGLPNLVTWTDQDWEEWSRKTGISKEKWLDDGTRRHLIVNRVNL